MPLTKACYCSQLYGMKHLEIRSVLAFLFVFSILNLISLVKRILSYQKFENPRPLFTEIEQPSLPESAAITVVGNVLICIEISVTHFLQAFDGNRKFLPWGYKIINKEETKWLKKCILFKTEIKTNCY